MNAIVEVKNGVHFHVTRLTFYYDMVVEVKNGVNIQIPSLRSYY